jgi:hypothetical protein
MARPRYVFDRSSAVRIGAAVAAHERAPRPLTNNQWAAARRAGGYTVGFATCPAGGLAAGASTTAAVSDVDGNVIQNPGTIKNRAGMPAVPAGKLMILGWSAGKWAVLGWSCA